MNKQAMAQRVFERYKMANSYEVESPFWRAHKYHNTISIDYLKYAGKRGKKVTRCSVSYSYAAMKNFDVHDYAWKEITKAVKANVSFEKMMDLLKDIKDYVTDLLVDIGVSDPETDRTRHVATKCRDVKAVDVLPYGVRIIDKAYKYIFVKASPKDFIIQERDDPTFGKRCVPSPNARKSDITMAYRWFLDNENRLNNYNINDVIKVFRELGIRYHTYYGLD